MRARQPPRPEASQEGGAWSWTLQMPQWMKAWPEKALRSLERLAPARQGGGWAEVLATRRRERAAPHPIWRTWLVGDAVLLGPVLAWAIVSPARQCALGGAVRLQRKSVSVGPEPAGLAWERWGAVARRPAGLDWGQMPVARLSGPVEIRCQQLRAGANPPGGPSRYPIRTVPTRARFASVAEELVCQVRDCHGGIVTPPIPPSSPSPSAVDYASRRTSQSNDFQTDLLKSQSADFIDKGDEPFEYGHLIGSNHDRRVAGFIAESGGQAAFRYGVIIQK